MSGVLDKLAGEIDEATMRDLNSQVDQDALAPATVARAALAGMGLIENEGFDIAGRCSSPPHPSALATPRA